MAGCLLAASPQRGCKCLASESVDPLRLPRAGAAKKSNSAVSLARWQLNYNTVSIWEYYSTRFTVSMSLTHQPAVGLWKPVSASRTRLTQTRMRYQKRKTARETGRLAQSKARPGPPRAGSYRPNIAMPRVPCPCGRPSPKSPWRAWPAAAVHAAWGSESGSMANSLAPRAPKQRQSCFPPVCTVERVLLYSDLLVSSPPRGGRSWGTTDK